MCCVTHLSASAVCCPVVSNPHLIAVTVFQISCRSELAYEYTRTANESGTRQLKTRIKGYCDKTCDLFFDLQSFFSYRNVGTV